MNPMLLWNTEPECVLDVTLPAIKSNGRRGHAGKHGASGSGDDAIPSLQAVPKQDDPAAAPPEHGFTQYPLDGSQYVDSITTDSTVWRKEPTPADERCDYLEKERQAFQSAQKDEPAWVPWHGGECPVPGKMIAAIRQSGRECDWNGKGRLADELIWSVIDFYRLANPKPRGEPILPPDHPHAEKERLWCSDDTLRVWWWHAPYRGWEELSRPGWREKLMYHVGHQPPAGSA